MLATVWALLHRTPFRMLHKYCVFKQYLCLPYVKPRSATRAIPPALEGSGLLVACDAKNTLGYQHSGFSVNAGVCIEALDLAALV